MELNYKLLCQGNLPNCKVKSWAIELLIDGFIISSCALLICYYWQIKQSFGHELKGALKMNVALIMVVILPAIGQLHLENSIFFSADALEFYPAISRQSLLCGIC
jgi:hypothetical protein